MALKRYLYDTIIENNARHLTIPVVKKHLYGISRRNIFYFSAWVQSLLLLSYCSGRQLNKKVLVEAVLATDCGDTYGADLGTSSKESY